jgi:hypothetical protein
MIVHRNNSAAVLAASPRTNRPPQAPSNAPRRGLALHEHAEIAASKDYQRYAARCLQEARTTDAQHKAFLIEMAQACRALRTKRLGRDRAWASRHRPGNPRIRLVGSHRHRSQPRHADAAVSGLSEAAKVCSPSKRNRVDEPSGRVTIVGGPRANSASRGRRAGLEPY